MPQDTAFTLPFDTATSPDADAARRRSLLWSRRQGLVADPVDEARFLRWDIAGLMAVWNPRTSGARLDLTVDAVVVATFLDDHVDGPPADRPERVGAVCADFARVIAAGGRPPAGAGPLLRAFGDVWQRLADGASPAWLERTGQHWQWYLGAYAQEARNRAHRRVPTLAEYAELRRRSGFVYAMLDLSQKAYGFELPDRLYTQPVVRRMADITADVVDTLNDVHSVEKEESRGDVHNLVLVIENDPGRARSRDRSRDHGRDGAPDHADSIREIQGMVTAWCEEFLVLEQRLASGVGPREAGAAALITDCMRTAMSGYLEWSRTTRRYSHLVPAGEAALAADLVQTN
ncbi:terpene synthase family protein [Kitasatospora sp. NPDC059160]|uniref:terpene synthase family protein n=1 Tax=Kitasatospora sp. NPDC059160 TaxID=3346748 RepID=UPI003696E3A2